MAREQVRCHGKTAASADAVWQITRDFCSPWHPAIATMVTERSQGGAQVRVFTVKGEDTVYREQLTYFSDSDRVIAYRHIEGIRGAERYDARLTVTPADDGGAIITMSADLTAPASRAAEIASGTKQIFDMGIEALGNIAPKETAPESPSPPAGSDVPLEDITIDELPRLALTVAGAVTGTVTGTVAGTGTGTVAGTATATDTTSATPNAASTKNGPLCLFLHGIGGARLNWREQLSAVAPYMRAAALDLRGYGGSTLGAVQTTIDDYCDDILRIRHALGADKLVLCGLSYGSWIATSFAMRYPEMLAGVILSGGCTGMSEAGPDERDAFRVSREVPLDAGQTPADFAPSVVEVLASPTANDVTREALRTSMAAIPADSYRDALICFTNPLERFDFSRLSLPVLMMTGEYDRLAPPAEIRSVAGRIWDEATMPDIRFEVIDGAGHVCNVEDPVRYNAILTQFLARLRP